MEDLKPLEWLNNISIVEAGEKPIQLLVSSKKKKLSLEYLLKNFNSILGQFRSPSRRPTFSYATLILLALHFSPTKQSSLSQIYNWIKSTFPYYANPSTSPAWKNSIRHNLSLNKCFVKVPRDNKRDKPGKGGFWKLDESCEKKLMEGDNFYRLRKKRSKKGKKSSGYAGKSASGKVDESRLEPIELEQVLVNGGEDVQETNGQQFSSEKSTSTTGTAAGESTPLAPPPPHYFYATVIPPYEEEIVIETSSCQQSQNSSERQAGEVLGSAAAAGGHPPPPANNSAATAVSAPQELNELNIVLEEYYYDPSNNGCFEELELDIEHLISIGGF